MKIEQLRGDSDAKREECGTFIAIQKREIRYTFYSNLLNGTWSGGTYNDHFYSNMI